MIISFGSTDTEKIRDGERVKRILDVTPETNDLKRITLFTFPGASQASTAGESGVIGVSPGAAL